MLKIVSESLQLFDVHVRPGQAEFLESALELGEIYRRIADNLMVNAAVTIGDGFEFRADDLHRIGVRGGTDEAFLAQ